MDKGLLAYLLIPLFTAVLIPFAARRRPKLADILANVTLLAGLVNLCWLVLRPSVIAGAFVSVPGDGFSIFLVGLIYLVALCVSFFSTEFLPEDMPNRRAYYSLILISVAAMCGIVTTSDFFTLYVFVEVLAVTSFALITTDESKAGVEGALKYFLLTFPASALIMIGISILLLTLGSLSFEGLRAVMASGIPPGPVLFAAALIILGFLIKSGVVPFHAWTPDAYQGAYAPVAAYLGGIVTKISGVYAVVRIATLLNFFDGAAAGLSGGIMFLGMLSIAVGALAALKQKDFKRMLAFSSISQVGYIILAAGLGTPLAFIGAIFHLFNHATFKTVLFLNSASLEKAAGTTDMEELGGMEHAMPWTSWTSIIALLSTAGVPPLSGFWSKLLIILALWESGFKTYAVLALLFSIVTLGYFLLMQKNIFFGKKTPVSERSREVSAVLLTPVLVMSAVIVTAGLLFPYFYSYVWMVAERIFL
ncbi:MAG: NADH-quinone oxidoreductase subunit L [Elusimicrobia bacterium CG08_land_8_20_14_0_20_59_10]|nr:MAG: NADH-quinone oxidoreductase subunit L [Elusimicrobia bacterium CG08_land_8_20_14_0_20_59_10]